MKYVFIGLGLLLAGCVSGHCHSDYADLKDRSPASEESIASAFITDTAQAQPAHVFIYKPDGSKQCGQGRTISPEVMEQQLKGIQVYSRRSGHDHKMHMMMCGAATGKINIFEIDQADLKKAEELGFKYLKTKK